MDDGQIACCNATRRNDHRCVLNYRGFLPEMSKRGAGKLFGTALVKGVVGVQCTPTNVPILYIGFLWGILKILGITIHIYPLFLGLI